jgi:hypothetical protein
VPSYSDHIAQATHNEKFGLFLKKNLAYKDWLITVCYYASLHYVEAKFATLPNIQHSTLNIPKDPNTGKDRYSVHGWRNQLIKQNLPQKVFICYRKLEESSQTARYLDVNRSGSASSFFTDQNALDMFDKNLQTIKTELKLP